MGSSKASSSHQAPLLHIPTRVDYCWPSFEPKLVISSQSLDVEFVTCKQRMGVVGGLRASLHFSRPSRRPGVSHLCHNASTSSDYPCSPCVSHAALKGPFLLFVWLLTSSLSRSEPSQLILQPHPLIILFYLSTMSHSR